MRRIALALALSGLASCAGGGPRPADGGSSAPITAELLPFEARPAQFADAKDGVLRTMRTESAANGARLLLEVPGGPAREVRVTRGATGLLVSSGPGDGTELLRFGAVPGDAWESGGMRVSFDGWERLTLANAVYDAARITARSGPAEVEHVETWWFAPGTGLVRVRSDNGRLFVDELVRASP